MKYITISREYGAGGRSVGLAIAKAFGMELYDRDIVRELAKESGEDLKYLVSEAESIHKWEAFWRTITPMQYDQKDSIYDMQRNIVLDFAKKGPCVIVGRCADVILKQAGYDCINVFLYGNEEFREKNMINLLGSEFAIDIKKNLKKIDAERAAFYKRYTGENWGDYKNYDILIDSSKFGFENTAKIIIESIKAIEE